MADAHATRNGPEMAGMARKKIATQLPLKQQRQPVAGKNSAAYWMSRVYKPVNVCGDVSPHYLMRTMFKGRRLAFGLRTGRLADAASQAAAIYRDLLTLGTEATLAKYRPQKEEAEPESAPARVATVGEWITAAEKVSGASPATFTAYARALRKIAGDIMSVRRSDKRYDYKHGGSKKYRAKIDAASLALLTPAALQRWRRSYVGRGKNPAAVRSRQTSCNSTIRQAMSLFSPRFVYLLCDSSSEAKLRLPDPHPFHVPPQIKKDGENPLFYPKANTQFRSHVNVKTLLKQAHKELAPKHPACFLAMLLALSAGLRRGEIDSLRWGQVDFGRKVIRLAVTEVAALKTQDSEADVPVDDDVLAILRKHYTGKKKPGDYVIEAPRKSKTAKAWGQNYRALPVFLKLTGWLRSKGVKARKPLHELRKELGAAVTKQHGIYAAKRIMRHSSVKTTEAHYAEIDPRSALVPVGKWLTEPDEPEPKKPTPDAGGKKPARKKVAVKKPV